MSDDDRGAELRGGDGLVDGAGDLLDVIRPRVIRLAMSRQVECEHSSRGIDVLEFSQRGSPHAAIKTQAMEQDDGRSIVGLPAAVRGKASEARGAVVLRHEAIQRRACGGGVSANDRDGASDQTWTAVGRGGREK